jgi:uncharacterized membrane protein YgaE (UPF0421/DUF939 family)
MGHAYVKNITASVEWPWFCIKANSQHRPTEAANKNREKKSMQACQILKCNNAATKKLTLKELPKSYQNDALSIFAKILPA